MSAVWIFVVGALAALVGVLALRINRHSRAVQVVLDGLWEAVASRFHVPLVDMRFEGKHRARVPLAGGVLHIVYPLTMRRTPLGDPASCQLSMHYATRGLPDWLELSAAEGTMRLGEVDLSGHTEEALLGLCQSDVALFDLLKDLHIEVAQGQVFGFAAHTSESDRAIITDQLESFVHGIDAIAEGLSSSPVKACVRLLAHASTPDFFGHIARHIGLSAEKGPTYLGPMARDASHEALGVWCLKGHLDSVKRAPLTSLERRHVLAHWAKHAPLGARSLRHDRARAVVAYLCRGETCASLDPHNLAPTPEAALPLLLHLYETSPEEVWRLSARPLSVMPVQDASVWIGHLRAKGHPLTLSHLVSLDVTTIPASFAQEILEMAQALAAQRPEVLGRHDFNQLMMGLLAPMSQRIFNRTADWLKQVGTPVTLQHLHKKERASLSPLKARMVQGIIDHLDQRTGQRGGLSLSHDDQEGALSLSHQAQAGDVTFSWEEQPEVEPQQVEESTS